MPGTGRVAVGCEGLTATLRPMRKDTENRRQAVRGLADEAAPRDHLPPDTEAIVDDVAPDEPARDESPRDDLRAQRPGQRTAGEAGDGVRPHNEGQAHQGPR